MRRTRARPRAASLAHAVHVSLLLADDEVYGFVLVAVALECERDVLAELSADGVGRRPDLLAAAVYVGLPVRNCYLDRALRGVAARVGRGRGRESGLHRVAVGGRRRIR